MVREFWTGLLLALFGAAFFALASSVWENLFAFGIAGLGLLVMLTSWKQDKDGMFLAVKIWVVYTAIMLGGFVLSALVL